MNNHTKKMIESHLDDLANTHFVYASVIDMQGLWQQFATKNMRLDSLLSEKELEYYDTLKLDKNKMQWVSGRYAVKLSFIKYKAQHKSLIDAACIDVLKRQDGSPYIMQYPSLCCSITHSYPYAIGVVAENKIGIDIEKIAKPSDALVKYFFSSKEKEVLAGCDGQDDFMIKAITFWTRKEALSKYLRMGMNISFKDLDTTNDSITSSQYKGKINLSSFVCNDFCISLAL